MPTKEELQSEIYDLQSALRRAKDTIEKLEKEMSGALLEIERLRGNSGFERGRADALDKAFNRLARHYELVHGKPEAIAAIASEEERLNRLSRNTTDYGEKLVR